MKPLIVVRDGFDAGVGSAYQGMRMGYYHGFRLLGMEPEFVEHRDIETGEFEDPLYWLTWDDYNNLTPGALEAVKKSTHIVMVNAWFQGMEKMKTLYGAPHPITSTSSAQKIFDSEPDFVWGFDPECNLLFYERWKEGGCRVVSLPWACDTVNYYPSNDDGFESTIVGFVGSYRGYKETQYEDYLWPYKDKLRIWSHSPWPRCYCGPIPYEKIRVMYKNARVCPTISEPSLPVLWGLPERPFDIMGSGGLTILDCVPTYTSFFKEDEVLMPKTVGEYRDMMDVVLSNEELNERYRCVGYEAVMERHTFVHRIQKLLNNLDRNINV